MSAGQGAPSRAGPRAELLERVITWFAGNGVGDTSLRTVAAAVGTSHRMLNYHFGSREGLLGAVVEEVERRERAVLEELLAAPGDPYDAALAFWQHVADAAESFAPLFFELSGQAMQGKAWAAPLRSWLTDGWTGVLTELYVRAGYAPGEAERQARIALALTRGLLFELALTGDRQAVHEAMLAVAELGRR